MATTGHIDMAGNIAIVIGGDAATATKLEAASKGGLSFRNGPITTVRHPLSHRYPDGATILPNAL